MNESKIFNFSNRLTEDNHYWPQLWSRLYRLIHIYWIIWSVITIRIFIKFFFSTSLKLHTDQDKGDGNLKYILTGDGAGSLFIIDENTGDIHAAKKLDREEKSLYVLRAKAIDRKTGRQVEPESEFIIKIHDINDNEPKFTKDMYTASIPEMSGVGR